MIQTSIESPDGSLLLETPRVNNNRLLRLIPRGLVDEHRDSVFTTIDKCRDAFLFISRQLHNGRTLHDLGQTHSMAVGMYSEEYVRINIERELELYIRSEASVLHVKRNSYLDHEKVDLLLDTGYGEYFIPIQVKSSIKAQRAFQGKDMPFIICLRPGEESAHYPYIGIIKNKLSLSTSNRVSNLFHKDWKYV